MSRNFSLILIVRGIDVEIRFKNQFELYSSIRKISIVMLFETTPFFFFFYTSGNIDRLQNEEPSSPLYSRVYSRCCIKSDRPNDFTLLLAPGFPSREVNRDFAIIIGGSSIHRWLEIHEKIEQRPRCVVTVTMIR